MNTQKKEARERLRDEAQDRLIHAAKIAFYECAEDDNSSEELKAEMRKQFSRIERLFGYVPGSNRI